MLRKNGKPTDSNAKLSLLGKVIAAVMGIPKGHIAYDKDYDDLPINVHGGLTYGQFGEDGLKWFGFDCAHAGDATTYFSFEGDHFWTLEEVIEETEKMAKQFSELTLRKIIEYKLEWMPDWFKENVQIKENVE